MALKKERVCKKTPNSEEIPLHYQSFRLLRRSPSDDDGLVVLRLHGELPRRGRDLARSRRGRVRLVFSHLQVGARGVLRQQGLLVHWVVGVRVVHQGVGRLGQPFGRFGRNNFVLVSTDAENVQVLRYRSTNGIVTVTQA